MKKKFINFLFYILFISLLTSKNILAQNDLPDKIKIAISGPMTGNYAAFGEQFLNGAKQAAKDINEKGGILGSKIILVP